MATKSSAFDIFRLKISVPESLIFHFSNEYVLTLSKFRIMELTYILKDSLTLQVALKK